MNAMNDRGMGATRIVSWLVLVGSCSPAYGSGVEDFVSGELRAISSTPVQAAVGQVIGQICPSGQIITNADLQDRCNEIAVAGAVNQDPDDDGGARDGLQAMGAEEDAAVASTQLDSSSGSTDAIGQRISSVRMGGQGATNALNQQTNGFDWSGGAAGEGGSSPWGFFVNGLYTTSDRDTTAREAGFDADDYGVTGGVDYNFADKVLIGAAFGYKDSDADIDNDGGKLDTESYSYFGYWSLYPDDYWFIDGMAGYTDNDHDQTRNIRYSIAALAGGTTTVSNQALSDTDSEEWSVSVTAGRNFHFGNWVAAPLARIEYADVEIDGYTESMALTGAGSGLALDIDGQDFESLMVTAGGMLTTEFRSGFGSVFPQITFEYVHEFKNDNAPITGRFVNDSSGTNIVLLTDEADRNFFNLGAGLTAAFSDTVSGFFRYQALLGYSDLDIHAFEVGVRASY